MAWTRDSTSGVYTHAGTTRDYWDPGTTLPVSAEVRLQCTAAAHNIKVYVRGAADGRSGFECGIEGANVIIRKITVGVTAAALATSAHGLTAGEDFTLRVRLTAESIQATVIRTSGAQVSASVTSSDWNRQSAWGWISSVDGAVVAQATVAEVGLSSTSVSDVLIAVCGGDVWACYNGERLQLIGSRVFPTESPVSLAVLDGLVYGVGGGKAVVIDAGDKEVSAYIPTSGSLPGDSGTGTTTAAVDCQYRGRIYFGAIEDEPSILYASAIGEALTLDTGELAEGHAEAIGVGRNQQIGDAVVALSVASNNALVIGCTNSIYVLVGDPADAGGELIPLSVSVGCSGPNAMFPTSEGVTAVHSPEGLWLVQPGGPPAPLSRAVLGTIIQYARSDRADYRVTLIRDPARHGLHVFIAPVSTAGGYGTHLWYDERTGGYDPAGGGWFPESYPFAPQCAVVWKGRVVIGTQDGRIAEFEDDATPSDFGSTAIDAYCTMTLADLEPLDNDTIVDHVLAFLGRDSGAATLTVYGGPTPEAAYDSAERWTLGTFTLPVTPQRVYIRKRGPALALVLRNNTAGEDFTFEALDAEVLQGRPIGRAGWKAALAVGAPCPVPAGSTGASPNSGASAVSGPGQGSLPTGGSPGSVSNFNPENDNSIIIGNAAA